MTLSRRAFLAGSTALTLAAPAAATSPAMPFSAQTVIERARELSRKSYSERPMVPKDWLDLTYDQYRDIRFRKNDALWADTNRSYNIDFFAPGLYFPRTIKVWSVEHGEAVPVAFNIDHFNKGKLVPDLTRQDPALGYSGLRLRTDLGHPSGKTEYAVFQGASYFRAIGLGMTYGLSGRGLALKTGDPMGEEFPDFIEFWLEAPTSDQENMVVHALMDSPSVTGAYRFDISPGTHCIMDVEAMLFPREELANVGIGPLTSMFLYDQTNRTRFDDFRPAVHDSDGLLVQNGNGEILWRPLANPTRLQISYFVDENPKGFGLMQRARELSDFADLEALYHNRPGLWVEPRGDWGEGSVVLVEIPTDAEIFDNIVAYWQPRTPMQPGEEVSMAYRLTWCPEPVLTERLPRVLNTAMGAHHNGARAQPGRLAAIDFEDHPLFADGPEAMTVHIASQQAATTKGVLQRNPATGGLRLVFAFDPGENNYAELRAQLFKDGQRASEVWLYRWTV
ncbi:MAG: glucan biosynthesis protein [Paracoccaceae bacterium]